MDIQCPTIIQKTNWNPNGTFLFGKTLEHKTFYKKYILSAMVVWWLTPLPHSKKVPCLNSSWGLSVYACSPCVLSGYCGFLPLPKNLHVRLIGVSKLTPGVSLVCLHVALWCTGDLLPNDSWDSPPRSWIKQGIENGWVDGSAVICTWSLPGVYQSPAPGSFWLQHHWLACKSLNLLSDIFQCWAKRCRGSSSLCRLY